MANSQAKKAYTELKKNGPQRPQISREELLKRFDTNGNGQIDPDEKRKAIEELRKNRKPTTNKPKK
jgi:hypothetical protein